MLVSANLRPHEAALLQAFALENNLFFFETSAKSNLNVAELFNDIATRLPKAAAPAAATSSGIALAEEPQPTAKRSACCS